MSVRDVDLTQLTGSGVLSGATARDRILAVLPALGALLPHAALQRGSVVGCRGSAGVSLALALAAGPSQEGAWTAVVGLPAVGVAAAGELGVVLQRLVMIAEPPEHFDDGQWADVLATMIDGFDVVLLGPAVQRVRTGTARRLLARAQSRGVVMITIGQLSAFVADVRFEASEARWEGLGEGHGVARARRVAVEVTGRRVHRAHRADLWLPAGDGQVRVVSNPPDAAGAASVVPLRRTG